MFPAAPGRPFNGLRPALTSLAALSALLLVSFAALSLDTAADDRDAAQGARTAGSPGALLAAERGRLADAAKRRATPEARRDRAASATRHRGLGAAEARGLVAQAFGDVVFDAPLRPLAGRTDVEFVNPRAASFRGPDGERRLLVTTYPLAGDEGGNRRLDLALEAGPGGWSPTAAATPLRVARTATGGAEVGERGLVIRPAGVASTPGTLVEGATVFYDNVARDTDYAVRPLPDGAETFHVLRSQDSPELLALDLDGADVVKRTPRGVRVLRDGRTIASVGEVAAADADGQPVDAELRIEGTTLSIAVPHRAADAKYPIVVDPAFDTFDWEGCTDGACSLSYAGWTFNHDLPAGRFNPATGSGPFGPGLYINGPTTATYFQDSDDAAWVYDPPGETEVDAVTLKHIDQSAAAAPNACVYAGVGSRIVSSTQQPGEAWDKPPFRACGPSVLNGSYSVGVAGDRPGNMVVFGGDPGGPGTFEDFVQHIGYVGITLVDPLSPYFEWPGWQKTTAAHVKVLDDGLGVKEATLTNAPRFTSACDGTRNGTGLCPASVDHAGVFAEGTTSVSAWAKDVLGNTRTMAGTIRVDTAPPVIQVSGGLWDRRDNAVTGRLSAHVTATDPRKAGSPVGTPTSGVSSIDLFVDGELDKSRPGAQGTWFDASCPTCTREKTVDYDPLDQAPGKRTLAVVVRDHAGNETRQSWDVNSMPELPVVSAVAHSGRTTQWVNGSSGASATFDAAARMPGIKRLGLERTDGSWSGANRDEACTRSPASTPCSLQRREAVSYDALAAAVPEGRFDVRGVAKDAVGVAPAAGDAARPRGLEAYFYDTVDLTGRFLPTTISQAQGHWDTAAPDPRVQADTWSLRLLGTVTAPTTGSYTFATKSDDGVRAWVNGSQVVNDWADHDASVEVVGGTITLQAGVPVPLLLDYYDRSGPAQVDLKWRKPGDAVFEDVPHDALSRPTMGWRTEYYENESMTGLRAALGRESVVNDSYATDGPVLGMPADGWSVRRATRVQPLTTGDYRFRTTYSDGAQLSVDGRVLLDDLAASRTTDAVHTSAPVRLTAGREHDVLVKHVDRSGASTIRLEWQRDNGVWEVVPTAQTVYPIDGRTAAWNVGVDRTAPVGELSGGLWDVRGTTVGHRQFPLHVRAHEGQPPHDTSGARKIDIYTVAEDPAVPSSQWQRIWRAGTDQACTAGNCERPLAWTMDTSLYRKLTHQVIVVVEDQAGNKREQSFKVTIDGTKPEVSLSGPATDAGQPGTVLHIDSNDRIDGVDGSGMRTLEVKLDGTRHRLYTRDCGTARCPQTWSLDHDFGTALGDGRHDIEVVATDDAANSVSATAVAHDPRPPINTGLPQIVEPADATPVGHELETTDGQWSQLLPAPDHRFEYQWRSCDAAGANCADIAGATAKRYRVTPDQLGRRLRSVVVAINLPSGNERRSAPATSPPSREISPDVADPILLEPAHSPALPQDWVDVHHGEVTGTAVDVGLGLHRMELTEPLVPSDQVRAQRFKALALSGADCDGTITAMCPPAGSQTFQYQTGPYREGYVGSAIEAVDAAERRSGKKSWTLKVDHTPPGIAFNGPAGGYAGGAITDAGTYPLAVDATDGVRGGTPQQQRSGVDSLELLVSKDEGEFVSRGVKRFDDCTGDSCPGSDDYTVDTAALGEGLHAVKAIAKDRLYDRVPDELKHRHIRESVMRFYVDLERPFLDSVAHDPNPPTDWVHAQALSVTGSASDDGTGVHRFVLTRPALSGGNEIVAGMGCQLSVEAHLRCPQAGASRRIDYNTADVAEGDGVQLSFKAVDAVGRESDPNQWTLKVDHTAPAAPSDFSAAHDAARSRAIVSWEGSPDPLANGAPGSGVAHYTYQVKRAGGEWSAVQTTPAPYVAMEGFAAGETFSMRVRAVDRVGLVSAETETSLAMGDAPGTPQITVSGRLWNSAGDTVLPGPYGLMISAVDGNGSGVRRVVLRVNGVFIDAVERACPEGGCALAGTFWLNTAHLPAGDHVVTASAIDEDGVLSRRRWGFTVNPIRTTFELEPSVTLDEARNGASAANADWVEFTHTGGGEGGFILGHEPHSEGVEGYLEGYAEDHGPSAAPAVSGLTVGGDVATEALGPLAGRVTSREVYTPVIESGADESDVSPPPTAWYDDALMAADEAAEEGDTGESSATVQGGSDAGEPAPMASAAAGEDSKRFSPRAGAVHTRDQGGGKLSRRMNHRLTFGEDALPDDESDSPFERPWPFLDHGYEHDFKLKTDVHQSGSGVHPFCDDEKERFWAHHKGVEYETTFPKQAKPYLDSHVGDNCDVMDFTVGVKYPLELQSDKTYRFTVKAAAGEQTTTPYQLIAQKTMRICPGDPRACSVTKHHRAEGDWLASQAADPPKPTTMECRRWRKGRASRRTCTYPYN